MYVRGSDQNVEYKRPVDGFFRGIVINNEDPNSLMRVKAFIPELVNFNFIEEANVKGNSLSFGAPQMNTALDGPLVEKLKPLVPWAEQAAGLFGEAGSSHWNSPSQQQWTKTNYGHDLAQNALKAGFGKGRGPLLPREAQNDATANPTPGDVWTTKKHGLGSLNPSGFGYGPVNSGARASGVYGVPQVGSQVWIFHEQGNVNFPIYFAAIPAYKETAQVFRNGTGGGPFENGSGNTPTDPEDTGYGPPMSPTSGSLLKPGDPNIVDSNSFYRYMEGQIPNSSLNGYWPRDGARYGIPRGTGRDGQPANSQERDQINRGWARYFTRLSGLESDFDRIAHGDKHVYRGGSRGLFQLSFDDALGGHFNHSTPFNLSQLEDPEFNTAQAIRIHESLVVEQDGVISEIDSEGNNLGASRYWGTLRRARADPTNRLHAQSWYGTKHSEWR